MLCLVMMFVAVLSVPCESAGLQKRNIVDDPLLTLFRQQELLLQKVERQVNYTINELNGKFGELDGKFSELDSKMSKMNSNITKQNTNLESAIDDVENFLMDKLCPRGFYPNYFGCFKFIYDTLTHDDAEARCRSDGGHLVELKSKEKSEALASLMDKHNAKTDALYHIGGRKVNNMWTWIESRGPFTFTNWWSGKGSDECVTLYYRPGHENNNKWDDVLCTANYNSICEI